MGIRDALKSTMDQFSLTAVALAKMSGVTNSRLSRFLQGNDMKTGGLDDLFNAFDDEALRHFLSQLVVDRDISIVKGSPSTLAEEVNYLSPEELADLLNAVSARLRKSTTANVKKSRQLTLR